MKALIYPYKPGSESSAALAEGLGIKRVAHKNSKFKGNKDTLIINWGASKVSEEVSKCTILNLPQAVALASDKLQTFKVLNPVRDNKRKVRVAGALHDVRVDHELFAQVEDDFIGAIQHPRYGAVEVLEAAPRQGVAVRTPEFTTDRYQAMQWLGKGFTVVERHILNGNSGAGIRLVEPVKEGEAMDEEVNAVQRCPLYVKYVPKKQEYRIHVCGGEAVDIQRKARRKDVPDENINWKVRNHDNGFIFARNEDGVVPPDVVNQAVNAVKALGLDFGAVDVIFNDKEQQAYVLEVNTAPGLAGETLQGYLKRFGQFINGEVALPQQEVAKGFVGAPDIPKVGAKLGELVAGPKIKRPMPMAEFMQAFAVPAAPIYAGAHPDDDFDDEPEVE
jgi:glutathione synthase/RimK-type ligase-like ATP-grasp enzyme